MPLPRSSSWLLAMGFITDEKVNPFPDVVVIACCPFWVLEMEQCRYASLVKTSGGYVRCAFHESVAGRRSASDRAGRGLAGVGACGCCCCWRAEQPSSTDTARI